MIRAVIFDFGNVLSRFDVGKLVRALSPFTDLPPTAVRRAFMDDDLAVRYETGLVTTDEFITTILHRGRLSMTKEAFVAAYTGIFEPIHATMDLVRALKPNYTVSLLSNTNELHFEHVIRKIDVFGLFDTVTLSFRVKAMKPAAKIYQDALAQVNLGPEQCVFIDDLEENIDAARKLGIHGVHYTSHQDLLTALRQLDINLNSAEGS
ncbi:MAG: HAD family phosphatase [Ignavibacteria bacterium]|nr:HAD family phosphatase [Ignavibacteria bacterium]